MAGRVAQPCQTLAQLNANATMLSHRGVQVSPTYSFSGDDKKPVLLLLSRRYLNHGLIAILKASRIQ